LVRFKRPIEHLRTSSGNSLTTDDFAAGFPKRCFLSRKLWHERSDESGDRPGNHSTNSTEHTVAFRPTRSTDFLTGDRFRLLGAALVPTSATSNCLIWQYRLGHPRKRVSGSDWDQHSCSRPRPPSSLVKARGRRVRHVQRFIPGFRGC